MYGLQSYRPCHVAQHCSFEIALYGGSSFFHFVFCGGYVTRRSLRANTTHHSIIVHCGAVLKEVFLFISYLKSDRIHAISKIIHIYTISRSVLCVPSQHLLIPSQKSFLFTISKIIHIYTISKIILIYTISIEKRCYLYDLREALLFIRSR